MRITECSKKPNCICSIDSKDSHRIEPFQVTDEGNKNIEFTFAKLRDSVQKIPRVLLVTQEPGYLHFIFITGFMRFKDDVYFEYDSESKLIHFKSASRLGYSDWGANRKRHREISKIIDAKLADLIRT